MSCVLTLIVKPGDAATLQEAVETAHAYLVAAGANPADPVTLGEGEAVDICFTPLPGATPKPLQLAFEEALGDMAVDIAVQRTAERAKRLLLADMDSTMIKNECVDELADYAGVKAEVAEITARAMRGELVFESALTARVALLKGLSEAVLQRCLEERITLNPGARSLIQTAKQRGIRTVLVSGGFTFFTGAIGARLGFDRHVSNQLEVIDGVLTGAIIPPLSGPGTKFETLEAECSALEISAAQVIAVGDGANDIPMLEAAGLGVAVHAKPAAAAASDVALRFADLTGLLYLMGIPKSDFAAAR